MTDTQPCPEGADGGTNRNVHAVLLADNITFIFHLCVYACVCVQVQLGGCVGVMVSGKTQMYWTVSLRCLLI